MHSSKNDEEWASNTDKVAMDEYQPGSEAERKLVRKMDLHIVRSSCSIGIDDLTKFFSPFCQIPTVWVLYTLSYLDRANIGNAKSGGMEEDLNLSSTVS